MGITTSATFVVDIDSLRHPDDIKKDEFGKWLYNVSHLHVYVAWKDDDDKLGFDRLCKDITMDKNMFQLRRIYCKHPSNPQFQRLLVFVTKIHITCAYHHIVCLQALFHQ